MLRSAKSVNQIGQRLATLANSWNQISASFKYAHSTCICMGTGLLHLRVHVYNYTSTQTARRRHMNGKLHPTGHKSAVRRCVSVCDFPVFATAEPATVGEESLTFVKCFFISLSSPFFTAHRSPSASAMIWTDSRPSHTHIHRGIHKGYTRPHRV